MSTKTKWIVGLAAINVAILPFTFAPKRTGARPPADGWLDCCRETGNGAQYCCVGCCWLTHDCGPAEPCRRLAATVLDTPS